MVGSDGLERASSPHQWLPEGWVQCVFTLAFSLVATGWEPLVAKAARYDQCELGKESPTIPSFGRSGVITYSLDW